MSDGLSMEDRIFVNLTTDGTVHVFEIAMGRAMCGADVESAAGPLNEHPDLCEECVTNVMVGLIVRQGGVR